MEAVIGKFCKFKCFTNQYYNSLLAEEDSDVKNFIIVLIYGCDIKL